MDVVDSFTRKPKPGANEESEPEVCALPEWYVHPSDQIERFMKFNHDLGGVNEGHFGEYDHVPKLWPRTKTEVLMYMPYRFTCGISYRAQGLRYFEDLLLTLLCADTRVGYASDLLRDMNRWSQPSLRCGINDPVHDWVAIDLHAYLGLSPTEARERANQDAQYLAWVEVLMAMVLFPDLIESWEYKTMPLPWLSGMEISSYVGLATPCVYHNRFSYGLTAGISDHKDDRYASPTVRQYWIGSGTVM